MADDDLVLDELDAATSEQEPEAQLPAQAGDDADGDDDARTKRSAKDLETVYDIPVQVSAVLGKSAMQVSELLRLGSGTVVELDRKIGEPIDIFVNNRLVARGEVVVVDDRLGVTMTEIIKTDRN